MRNRYFALVLLTATALLPLRNILALPQQTCSNYGCKLVQSMAHKYTFNDGWAAGCTAFEFPTGRRVRNMDTQGGMPTLLQGSQLVWSTGAPCPACNTPVNPQWQDTVAIEGNGAFVGGIPFSWDRWGCEPDNPNPGGGGAPD